MNIDIENDILSAEDTDEIKEIVTNHVRSAITRFEQSVKDWVTEQLEKYRGDIFEVGTKCDRVEKCFVESRSKSDQDVEKEVEKLRHLVRKNEQTIKELGAEIETLQMYSRRNSVRIFGVPENTTGRTEDGTFIREDTNTIALDIFHQKLGLDLSKSDICRSHRVGATKNDKHPRPILVKFVRHDTKDDVIRARAKLAGKKIVLREDLTAQRMNWIRRLKDAGVHYKSIQSNDGVISIKLENGHKYIRTSEDLNTALNIVNSG